MTSIKIFGHTVFVYYLSKRTIADKIEENKFEYFHYLTNRCRTNLVNYLSKNDGKE
ncbi:hypothetical protein GCM10011397_03020 [Wenyingzhuangia marina]|nr:hypothetical protein GCM10011397_03020 [Wenyingzhuangia marina]